MVCLAAALACAMATVRNINASTGDFRERTIESTAPTFARADDHPTAPASYSLCGLARTPQDSRILWIFVGARGDELPPRVHASRPPRSPPATGGAAPGLQRPPMVTQFSLELGFSIPSIASGNSRL